MARTDHARQAERLLDLWSSLASRHVALGTACACGAGGLTLMLDDFELDIFGYLQDGAARSGDPDVAGYFTALHTEPPARPLVALLEAAIDDRVPEATLAWVLPRLERTLSSFAELHGLGQGNG